jgi:hypothetical protein
LQKAMLSRKEEACEREKCGVVSDAGSLTLHPALLDKEYAYSRNIRTTQCWQRFFDFGTIRLLLALSLRGMWVDLS